MPRCHGLRRIRIGVVFQSQTRSRPGCHDEKVAYGLLCQFCFNLKREAAPVATRVLHFDQAARKAVSISNEKPPRLPLSTRHANTLSDCAFQSQTRSRPGCHYSTSAGASPFLVFQSQPRSRPGCHTLLLFRLIDQQFVSISNEKPPRLPRR